MEKKKIVEKNLEAISRGKIEIPITGWITMTSSKTGAIIHGSYVFEYSRILVSKLPWLFEDGVSCARKEKIPSFPR